MGYLKINSCCLTYFNKVLIKSRKNIRIIFAAVVALAASGVSAEEARTNIPTDSVSAFTLGEVTVDGHRPQTGVTLLDPKTIATKGLDRLSTALDILPGLTVRDAGARNEGIFYLRGFDQRRVPVFIDGTPVYIPYDASVDINRLSTASLGEITVEKGMPSIMLGGNAMGGAINLVSRRPDKRLEINGEVNTLWNASLNAGSRLKKFYVQLGGDWLKRPDMRLPHDFKPVAGVQESRKLRNSKTDDFRFTSKIGFTPNETDEYVIGYSLIRANKDVPVYLGENGKRRYWRYTRWDKDAVQFHSNTAFGENFRLATRVFYDRYYNRLAAYDDITMTTQDLKGSFTSIYNDYSAGGAATLHYQSSENSRISIGATWKEDVHRAHNVGEPVARQRDDVYSIAAEDRWTLSPSLQLTAGIGYFGRKGRQVQAYEDPTGGNDQEIVDKPLTSDGELNYQASVLYSPTSMQSIKFSFARTSRFATLSERYSYKFGKSWPNPDLESEQAYNLDITYTGQAAGLTWTVSGFYSFITNVIQDVTGVDPEDPKVWQPRNAGRAQFRGVEVSVGKTLFRRLTLSASYTYLDQVNKSNPEVRFIDVPRNKMVASFDWNIGRGFGLGADMVSASSAFSQTDGSGKIPGYAVFNVIARKSFVEDLVTVRAGVKNLFDKLYYFTEGYPREGRVFYASVVFNVNML